jgi:CheY-like chemotaxis protein
MTPLKVLVVDDNRDAADTLMLLLVTLGHEAVAAYNGLEAVELASRFGPDCVIMDLDMPRMDGFTAAANLRAVFGRRVVLAALSGHGRSDTAAQALAAGFDFHHSKPLTPVALGALLASSTKLRDAEQQRNRPGA